MRHRLPRVLGLVLVTLLCATGCPLPPTGAADSGGSCPAGCRLVPCASNANCQALASPGQITNCLHGGVGQVCNVVDRGVLESACHDGEGFRPISFADALACQEAEVEGPPGPCPSCRLRWCQTMYDCGLYFSGVGNEYGPCLENLEWGRKLCHAPPTYDNPTTELACGGGPAGGTRVSRQCGTDGGVDAGPGPDAGPDLDAGNPDGGDVVRITAFTATPPSIASGGTSRLRWTVDGSISTRCALQPGAIFAAWPSGYHDVSPTSNTTYSLTCTSPGSSDTATVDITIIANDSPIALIDAPDASVSLGAGDTAAFSGHCTDDMAGGTALTHAWDFGLDADPTSASDPDGGVVRFLRPGSYLVSYTCTDALGATSAPAQLGVSVTEPVFARLAGATSHTCGVTEGGALFCWGDGTRGKLGQGPPAGSVLRPRQVGSANHWASVDLGGDLSCALTTTGQLNCWGFSTVGVGDGVGVSRDTPTAIGTAIWTQFSVGVDHACAIDADAGLYCWGANAAGELGVGDQSPRSVPTQVGAATDWVAVSAGWNLTCGLRSGSGAYCWGDNANYAVGDGTTTRRLAPVQIGTSVSWAGVSASAHYACGTSTTAWLYCWGDDSFGQLGDGTKGLPRTRVPTRSGTAADWASVSAGYSHACARKVNGSLHCWGNDAFGQLGNGPTLGESAVPAPLDGGFEWKQVQASEGYTCAVHDGGQPWCWGRNLYGALGVGTQSTTVSSANDSQVPVQPRMVP